MLEIIKENPLITQKQMAEVTKLTIDGIKYNITILKNLNIIERVGSDRKGYWKTL